jgi:hypothetical protein
MQIGMARMPSRKKKNCDLFFLITYQGVEEAKDFDSPELSEVS